jgi:hypothetical protein
MGSFIFKFSHMRNIFISFIPSTQSEKPGIYLDICNLRNCTFLKYSPLRTLNKFYWPLKFPTVPDISSFGSCHYSRHDILAIYVKHLQASANTLYEKYPPHTNSPQILDGKSFMSLWTKGNITRHSTKHLNTHCTSHYICSRPDYKIHL